MILKIEDWVFEVDVTATMEHAAAELEHRCDCGYCRNFYQALDGAFPDLRPFLAQFGVNTEVVEELMPIEPTLYLAYYSVNGRILEFGRRPIVISDQSIMPELPDSSYLNSECTAPYFLLALGLVELPWVLEEPADEVVSPANEPSFLQKMLDRILKRTPNDHLPT